MDEMEGQKIAFHMNEEPNEKYCKYLRENWSSARGLKISTSSQMWAALVKKPFKKPSYMEYIQNRAGDDHCTLWNKNGKPHCWVSQPYHFGLQNAKEAIERAEKYGLDFKINTFPAWHYPGHVIFIVWTRKGE